MLEGAPRDPSAGGRRPVGKRLGEIGERDSATPREHRVRKVAEPTPEPRRGGNGQRCDGGGEEPEPYLALRLRSRMISTAIGISESTITTITTT